MSLEASDYTEIIRIYNASGKSEANAYIKTTYDIKNPYSLMNRIRQMDQYHYDKTTDRFLENSDLETDRVFMDFDELCNNGNIKKIHSEVTMDSIIKQLVEERLLQLSNYIQMNQSSRTVLIDQTSMHADGFKVIIH